MTSATWNADAISRVRSTEFDDSATASSSQTSVCVQLVKASSTGSLSEVADKSGCSTGRQRRPHLDDACALDQYPAVPTLCRPTRARCV